MIYSHYGREEDKFFKYSEFLLEDESLHEDNFFGDLVDHWFRYEDWKEDEIYPEENVLFHGAREDKEIKLIETDASLILEYGISVKNNHPRYSVNNAWESEMKPVIERNMEKDFKEVHVGDQTMENISGNGGKLLV